MVALKRSGGTPPDPPASTRSRNAVVALKHACAQTAFHGLNRSRNAVVALKPQSQTDDAPPQSRSRNAVVALKRFRI